MRWRIEQKDLKYRDGTPLSKEKAWNMTTNGPQRRWECRKEQFL